LAVACASTHGRVQLHAASAATAPEGELTNAQAVDAVCTACHGSGMYMNTPRSWIRWTEVFRVMSDHGATGTDEQLDQVVTYFLENLTIVNVNTSPAEQLGPVLGVSEQTVQEIIARRERARFTGMPDLAGFRGVDRAILKRREKRIQF